MSLKKILETINENTIKEINWRREMWEEAIQKKKQEIKRLREEIREMKSSLILDNELLKKYKQITFDDILDKQTITTEDKVESLRRTYARGLL